MEGDEQGNEDIAMSDDEIFVQDDEDTLAYYIPKDELKQIAEYKEGEEAHFPDIRGPINPIFRRLRWIGMTDWQWMLVEPVLRLASAFLETEASFVVLYSIINARKIRLPGPFSAEADKHMIRRLDPLTHYRRTRTELKDNMAMFGDNICWRITNLKRAVNSCEDIDCYARTQRCNAEVIRYSNSVRKNIVGNGSVVSMHKGYWRALELLESHKRTRNSISNAQLASRFMRIHILMATTFCHELAHVVHIGSHQGTECYWENDAVAEYGRVWEQEVFGGTLRQQTPFALDEPSFFVKWPDIYALEWATEDEKNTRAVSKGSSTFYVVPLRWMVEVTSQRFWFQYFLDNSRSLLWIPKRLGVRLLGSSQDSPWWRLSQSSEGAYPADDNRIVRRGWVSEVSEMNEPVRDSPGPAASRTRSKTAASRTRAKIAEKRKRSSSVKATDTEDGRASKRRRA
ncbi:hypothetical protein MMC26_000941 [Xylographa opegraphella]|nr:hypothetical protein [Xylographa opegraphella]